MAFEWKIIEMNGLAHNQNPVVWSVYQNQRKSTKINIFEIHLQKMHMIPLGIEPPHVRTSFPKVVQTKLRRENIV